MTYISLVMIQCVSLRMRVCVLMGKQSDGLGSLTIYCSLASKATFPVLSHSNVPPQGDNSYQHLLCHDCDV